jgi:cytochrome c oxidase subunit 3
MSEARVNNSLGIFPKKWEQQYAGRIPGNAAIWVGILSELTEFAIFFVAYFIAKVHYAQAFASGPLSLNTTAGIANTLVLLSSSYFVAKAMAAIRQNKHKQCEYYLWLAVLAACTYQAIKVWEFSWNDARGIHTDTSEFFTVYYYMTFNHFLHVGWAGCAILWVIFRLRNGAYSAEQHSGLEAVATYWHMIDLMWILIFPLLYVLR